MINLSGIVLDRSVLARRLHDLRLSKGMSQEQFARETGMKTSEIEDIEGGKIIPSDTTIQIFADTLGVHRDRLIARYLFDIESQSLFDSKGQPVG